MGKKINLEMIRGDTFIIPLKIKIPTDGEVTPRDITPSMLPEGDIYFSCSTLPETDSYIFQKLLSIRSSSESVEIKNEDNCVIFSYSIVLQPNDTKIAKFGSYSYDVRMVVGSDIRTLAYGNLEIKPEVTI